MGRSLAGTCLLALATTLAASAMGCSLGNVHHDDCESSRQCEDVFGLGSTCDEGFCSAPASCTTGHDCRARFGGGACVSGQCTATLPEDPDCFIAEPADALTRRAAGDGSYALIGGIMSVREDYDLTLSKAARLAVREINRTGGLADGRKLGIVFCDNAGKSDADNETRTVKNEHAMDYLSGTLGVPVVLGPASSADALTLVNRVLQKGYTTAILSPSATSPALTKQPDRLDPADPYGLFWRTCPSDELQGSVLATKVIGLDTTIQKVAVIYVQDPYGEGLSQVFANTYGLDRTTLVPYDFGGDFAVVREATEAASPDAVLVIAVVATDTVAILDELAKSPTLAQKQYFFTDGAKDKATLLDPKLPAEVKAMIAGAKGTAPARPSGSNYDLFKADLAKDFDVAADGFSFLAQTYDAAWCAAYGLVYADGKGKASDGRVVAEGLAHLSAGDAVNVGPIAWPAAKLALTTGDRALDVVGASGELDFDATTGEAPGPIEIWGVAASGDDFVTESVVLPK
jgi:branched-chain amino acid transport system substrate-binding protein